MNMSFTLDPRLEKDTVAIGKVGLCQILLMKDARFSWIIIVPEIPGLTELHELQGSDYKDVMTLVHTLSSEMKARLSAHKMNVAALGNMVPQLHIHIIARIEGDAAWPSPVWGVGTAVPYTDIALERQIETFNSIIINITG
ncbi:MAG: HIT domain-containing protein [Sneathiellales bacterium]|nr:HIT domain-containing protein [Sneathiellales bacterium]